MQDLETNQTRLDPSSLSSRQYGSQILIRIISGGLNITCFLGLWITIYQLATRVLNLRVGFQDFSSGGASIGNGVVVIALTIILYNFGLLPKFRKKLRDKLPQNRTSNFSDTFPTKFAFFTIPILSFFALILISTSLLAICYFLLLAPRSTTTTTKSFDGKSTVTIRHSTKP